MKRAWATSSNSGAAAAVVAGGTYRYAGTQTSTAAGLIHPRAPERRLPLDCGWHLAMRGRQHGGGAARAAQRRCRSGKLWQGREQGRACDRRSRITSPKGPAIQSVCVAGGERVAPWTASGTSGSQAPPA